jgi:hypothetical protein
MKVGGLSTSEALEGMKRVGRAGVSISEKPQPTPEEIIADVEAWLNRMGDYYHGTEDMSAQDLLLYLRRRWLQSK